MTSFVTKHLGSAHINRNEAISNHTTTFANVLLGDSKSDVAIAVADGTYIYIEKGGNYSFQKRSYSVHKGKPLLKPMMPVATWSISCGWEKLRCKNYQTHVKL